VVDEERIRPDHQIGILLYIPFSELTLMAEWQEGQLTCVKLNTTNLTIYSVTAEENRGEPGNPELARTRSPAIAEGPRDAGVPVEIW